VMRAAKCCSIHQSSIVEVSNVEDVEIVWMSTYYHYSNEDDSVETACLCSHRLDKQERICLEMDIDI
jgi:hypothetical protein